MNNGLDVPVAEIVIIYTYGLKSEILSLLALNPTPPFLPHQVSYLILCYK